MDSRVKRIVLKHLKNDWGNASSVHEVGRRARAIIGESRRNVAKVLGSRPEEVVFTGSGTESDNLAIFGVARAYKNFGRHIITSKIEHHAVLRACQFLERYEGFKVTYLDVGKNGIINPADVTRALRKDTILVSIMYANNEIGTIQPVNKIAKIVQDFRNRKELSILERTPFFHSDACQAAGALNLNVNHLGVDLITLNGSKIYGPKATGCLYIRRGINPLPLIVGGNQEYGLRAGTENPAMIAGFAKALGISDLIRVKESTHLVKLRNYMIGQISETITGSHLNGDPILRLPNNINISFKGVDGEMLMLALDQKGIQVSTGSACTSTITESSHVIQALRQVQGKPSLLSGGNIRITLGRQTRKKDIDHVLEILVNLVSKQRR